MKQFSLEEFKKNPTRKVVTRDGKATARIICTDCKSEYPIIALLSYSENSEGCEAYTADGRFSIDGEGNSDLFFDVEKKEGYINLYRSKLFSGMFQTSVHVLSKDVAEREAAKYPDDFIATAKVTWEE